VLLAFSTRCARCGIFCLLHSSHSALIASCLVRCFVLQKPVSTGAGKNIDVTQLHIWDTMELRTGVGTPFTFPLLTVTVIIRCAPRFGFSLPLLRWLLFGLIVVVSIRLLLHALS
jgi:hypothetical protein